MEDLTINKKVSIPNLEIPEAAGLKEKIKEVKELRADGKTEEEIEKIEEERLMHLARFEKKAVEHAKRGFLRRILDFNAKLDAMDFARMEAIRDDESINKKMDEEYKMWEASQKTVIERLKFKRDNPNSPEAKKIHPLLIIMGGGMAGAYSAGQAGIGLPKVGIGPEVFDNVIGISAGACIGAYYVGNEPERKAQAAKVFYDQCCAGEFINFRRLKQIMDVRVIRDIIDHGGKDSLNEKGLLESKTGFFVVATNTETDKAEIIDAKKAKEGVSQAITASMAVPIVYGDTVTINGKDYVDGAFDLFPLHDAIKEMKPTDILILTNKPFQKLGAIKLSAGAWIFSELLGKMGSIGSFGSLGTAKKFFAVVEDLRKTLESAKSTNENNNGKVNIGIVWAPDSGISSLTQDPNDIRNAVAEGALDLIKRFGDKGKFIKDLELPQRTVLPD